MGAFAARLRLVDMAWLLRRGYRQLSLWLVYRDPRGPARPLFQKKDRVKNRQCGFIRCREFRTGRKAYDNAQLTLFRFVFQQKEGIVPAYGYRASAGHLNPSSAHRARLWVWRGSSGERMKD